jgi:hypothetical protein
MAEKEFDPKKFIDREVEADLFQELLRFADSRRILAIRDLGGMGKSQLLKKLRHSCRISRPRVPVSLVALDQLAEPTPHALVKQIHRDLDSPDIRFAQFSLLETARVANDFSPFLSSIYLQHANFQHASNVRIAGGMANVEGAQTVNVTVAGAGANALTPEQQTAAYDACVRAFLADLKSLSAGRPLVLLFDGFEKCDGGLRNWIEADLLERCFFDLANRPEQLLLVAAGRTLPAFDANWPHEDIEAVVGSVRQLGRWEKKHVEECLLAYGFSYEPRHLDLLYAMVEMGLPPSQVVDAIETMKAQRGGQP